MLLLSVLTHHDTTGGIASICCASVPDSNATPFVHFIGIFKVGKVCKNSAEQNHDILHIRRTKKNIVCNIPPKHYSTQMTVKGPSSPAEELAQFVVFCQVMHSYCLWKPGTALFF